ncbi:MAG: RNA polymerase sigma-70 factor [Mangrovibacterium sp.]
MQDNFKINEIVRALGKDKKEALDELFGYYYPRLFAFAKGFLKIEDDIDDLLQEVFISIWLNRHEIKNPESFNAYIFTATKNNIVSYFRKKIKEKEFLNKLQELTIAKDFIAQERIEYNELKQKVDQLIEKLPEKRKLIYKLSKEDGFSNKEISEKLGISVKTVEDHMTHAMRFLRENLKTLEAVSILYFSLFH